MSDEFVTYEGVKYRKVKRKANVGEKILIVKNAKPSWGYDKGSVLTVQYDTGHGEASNFVRAEDIGVGIRDDEYVVLEPVADESDIITIDGVKYRKVDREPRVGDYVYIQTDERSRLTKGKVYEIVEIDEDGDYVFYVFYDNDGDATYFYENDDDFQLVERIPSTTADIERELAELKAKVGVLEAQLAEKKAVEEPLKVGDYVKIVDTNAALVGFKLGEIVEIDSPEGGGFRHKVKNLSGKLIGFCDDHHITRATPEEVAEAKRKHEEVTKWAKIGREVGEFKVGDLVRYKYTSGNGNAIGIDGYSGIIAEIKKVGTSRIELIKPEFVKHWNGTWAEKYELELIAPVESVVNLRVSE